MMNKNKIGNQLKALRKAKNLTTQELADKVSISQSYLSRFENGRANPDIEMLESILTALGTNLSSFFALELVDMTEDLIQLLDTVKKLSTEASSILNEYLNTMLEYANYMG